MSSTLKKTITVAVAGNPNSGKTTIFNSLTGSRQHVGNYPGVTVEWKEGTVKRGDWSLKLYDLPGTYSLTAFSDEELVSRDFLLNHKPDVVVDVVDASNLERNLFLTTELLEIGLPVVVVLNMTDVARDRGLRIDANLLARRLGTPVVSTVGNKGRGMDELIAAVTELAISSTSLPGPADICRQSSPSPESLTRLAVGHGSVRVDYGPQLEPYLARILALLPQDDALRWRSVKLLEQDPEVLDEIHDPEVRREVSRISEEFATTHSQQDPDTILAGRRYEFIGQLCDGVLEQTKKTGPTTSDRIDRWTMHPVLGVPIFLALMYGVFTLTFGLGNPIMNLLDLGFTALGSLLNGLWPVGSASPLRSLLVDGIIGGVGGVVVFLPNIVLLFMAIAILEGTGYMARAAFVMDRLMSKVGLHGKSFIPLLIGFGCTVPAIMATRTLESRRDRLITIMVLPLMSCGARLPIYALMIPAFFPPKWHGPVLWIIYVTGIVLALVGARLLRATLFRGENTPFVMELPPYRMPTLKSLMVQMWTRAWLYVKKAGTVILGAAIILWFLTFYPKPPSDYIVPAGFDKTTITGDTRFSDLKDSVQIQSAELSYSIAGRVGRVLETVLKPLGFDWRIGTALVGAVAAKEVFVAQMGIVFAVGDADQTSEVLRTRLRERYSALVGFCIMLFTLISTPCIATFAITRQETGALKWAVAQNLGLTLLAWIVTFIAYHGGLLLGLGGVG